MSLTAPAPSPYLAEAVAENERIEREQAAAAARASGGYDAARPGPDRTVVVADLPAGRSVTDVLFNRQAAPAPSLPLIGGARLPLFEFPWPDLPHGSRDFTRTHPVLLSAVLAGEDPATGQLVDLDRMAEFLQQFGITPETTLRAALKHKREARELAAALEPLAEAAEMAAAAEAGRPLPERASVEEDAVEEALISAEDEAYLLGLPQDAAFAEMQLYGFAQMLAQLAEVDELVAAEVPKTAAAGEAPLSVESVLEPSLRCLHLALNAGRPEGRAEVPYDKLRRVSVPGIIEGLRGVFRLNFGLQRRFLPSSAA